jgi:YVTN family beta-propeller protein
LRQQVWIGHSRADSNLFRQVANLRKALGEQTDGTPYIKNISGSGYQFVAPVYPTTVETGSIPSPDTDAAQRLTLSPHDASASKAVIATAIRPLIAILGLILVAAGIVFFHRRQGTGVASGVFVPTARVIDGTESLPFPKISQFVQVTGEPVDAVLSKDETEIYVVEHQSGSIAVIDTRTMRQSGLVAVAKNPRHASPSRDGKRVYVTTEDGEFAAIDVMSKKLIPMLSLGEPIIDLAMSSDGKYAYLALGFRGLGKVDLASGSMKIVSTEVYVEAIAFSRDGHTLLVSYQSAGPGGTSGHDALGYFDTVTDRRIAVSKGFPNVGGAMGVFPSGSQFWEIGADACDSPQYDHIGCPTIPGGLINIFDAHKRTLVQSIGVRGARFNNIAISPNGEFAAIEASDRLMLMSTKSLSFIGTLPLKSFSKVAFSSNGSLGFLALPLQSAVAVLQFVLPIRVLRMANNAPSEEPFELAVICDSKLEEAKWIDPATLRLGGEPVRHNSAGSLDASLKYFDGFSGDSLIVRFNRSAIKEGSPMVLEGKTYSGIPVRGTLDP